jgi:sec-independent protein translocase protein TatA
MVKQHKQQKMFGIGGSELIFIILVAIMLFGADKIPDIAKTLGKGMAQLKNATDDIKYEITKSADVQSINQEIDKAKQGFNRMIDQHVPENPLSLDAITSDVTTEIEKAKNTIDDISVGPIKRTF